jgi:hypothetical protein
VWPGLAGANASSGSIGREVLANATYTRATASGSESQVTFKGDGEVWAKDDGLSGGTSAYAQDWWSPTEVVAGANFDIHVAATGDTLDGDSDATSTWLSLSTDRHWTLTNGVNATTETATLTVQIRYAGSQEVVSTATITLETDNS